MRHLPNATARARFASPVTAFSSLPQAETDADLAEWGITARASKAGAA